MFWHILEELNLFPSPDARVPTLFWNAVFEGKFKMNSVQTNIHIEEYYFLGYNAV
jgi:hypothetical protein